MEPRPLVGILDGNPTQSRELAQLLSAEGFLACAFADVDEFLAGMCESRPACAILEVRVGARSGLEIWHGLLEAGAPVPVIFLTESADIFTCVQAMRRGAVDFLTKPASPAALFDALRRAEALATRWRGEQAQRMRVHDRLSSLTPRERDVLALVLEGRRNKEIAAKLESQESTVKVHRSRFMRKLGARSLAELLDLREHFAAWRPSASPASRVAAPPRATERALQAGQVPLVAW